MIKERRICPAFFFCFTKNSAFVRPKINPPLTKTDIVLEALAGICLIYMIGELIVEYPTLDQQVPLHFNATGAADNWGNKLSLLSLSIINLVMYAGLTLLNKYPFIFNFPFAITVENASKQYGLAKSMIIQLKTGLVFIFGYIQHQMILLAQHDAGGLGIFFIAVVFLITFLPIILYFILSAKSK